MTVVERTKGAELDAAEHALSEAEQLHGRESIELRAPMDHLAAIYIRDGLCAKAELLYKRLSDIVSKTGNREATVEVLAKLAAACRCQNKFDEAEAVYLKALAELGDSPDAQRNVAEYMACLAGVYVQKREYGQAENALKKSAELFTQALGQNNNFSRLCHLGLASMMMQQGKNGEGEEQFAMAEKAAGDAADESTVQRTLIELAQDYFRQARFAEVDLLLLQTIYSDEHKYWPEHPRVGQAMHDRGELFRAQGKFAEAEKAFKKAMEIRLASLGQSHPELSHTAMSLAAMYIAQGRFSDAEPVLKQAMKTRVLVYGVEHPSVAAAIETYVSVLKNTKRASIAQKLEARARDIRTKLVWQSERSAAGPRSSSS